MKSLFLTAVLLAGALAVMVIGCDDDTDPGPDEWRWESGYSCDYARDRDRATCSGPDLTYCGFSNVIGTVNCDVQCVDWYDADATGTCGFDPNTSVNNCLCDASACDHAPYCADTRWLVQCDAMGVADEYVDCNAFCVEWSYPRGVCDSAECLCG